MRISYMIRMTIALIFDTISCEHYYKKSQRIWEIFLSFPKDSLTTKYLIFFHHDPYESNPVLCLSKKYLSNTFTNICYESRNCKLSQLNKVVSSSVWYLYTFKKKNCKLFAKDYGKSEVLYLFGLNHILGSLKTNFLVVK